MQARHFPVYAERRRDGRALSETGSLKLAMQGRVDPESHLDPNEQLCRNICGEWNCEDREFVLYRMIWSTAHLSAEAYGAVQSPLANNVALLWDLGRRHAESEGLNSGFVSVQMRGLYTG